ncbi:MAG: alpha/beta hydrolase [Acetobacteraceae bacterium]|nr:alpha/beta hydrolase [Acetobacteraceae bacterium]
MQVLNIGSYEMAYADQGEGTALILVHGSLLDQRYWAPQMEAFGQHYRTIAISLRHYWPEHWDGVGEDFTTQQHADDVAAFIAALEAGSVHLLGHSRGGHVAFHVARCWPDRIRSLLLAEPGGTLDGSLQVTGASAGDAGKHGSYYSPMLEHLRRGETDAALEIFLDAVSGPGTWSRANRRIREMLRDNARTLFGQVKEQRPPYSRDDAGSIRAPTLLIGGAKSPPPFPQIIDALVQAIPGAERVTIPHASHTMNLENPAAFNQAVLSFIAAH